MFDARRYVLYFQETLSETLKFVINLEMYFQLKYEKNNY